MKVQPFVAAVALLQIAAAVWSAFHREWKMAATNAAPGAANAVFCTMR